MYRDDYIQTPQSLRERLRRLGAAFRALGEDLKRSIAVLVGKAIADAVTDAIRSLLDGKGVSKANLPHDEADPWDERPDRSWEEDEDSEWHTGDDVSRPGDEQPTLSQRWRDAAGAAWQAGLWWLRERPHHSPVLTTVAVTAITAVTGFMAGPAFVACIGVLATAASMVLTARSAVGSLIR